MARAARAARASSVIIVFVVVLVCVAQRGNVGPGVEVVLIAGAGPLRCANQVPLFPLDAPPQAARALPP